MLDHDLVLSEKLIGFSMADLDSICFSKFLTPKPLHTNTSVKTALNVFKRLQAVKSKKKKEIIVSYNCHKSRFQNFMASHLLAKIKFSSLQFSKGKHVKV